MLRASWRSWQKRAKPASRPSRSSLDLSPTCGSARRKDGSDRLSLLPKLLPVYRELLATLAREGVDWVQVDEPALVAELGPLWQQAYKTAYEDEGQQQAKSSDKAREREGEAALEFLKQVVKISSTAGLTTFSCSVFLQVGR